MFRIPFLRRLAAGAAGGFRLRAGDSYRRSLRLEPLEDRRLLALVAAYDFGDAPDGPYPTLLASNGARHTIEAGFHLGASIDAETDGQPHAQALGDDLDGNQDDDVSFVGRPEFPGQSGTFTVNVTDNNGGDRYLNAWIDLDQDGTWNNNDPNEHFIVDAAVNAGDNPFTMTLPTGIPAGYDNVRFRLSRSPGLTPEGPAEGGEVEDYAILIKAEGIDFGDAPLPYPTYSGYVGAVHSFDGNLFLGSLVDHEYDGQPHSTASGDDNDGNDDEDGVIADGPLYAGQTTQFTVIGGGSSGGLLDAWFDLNQDGDWDDPGEQLVSGQGISPGSQPVDISIPASAALGNTFARFRVSSSGGLDPRGYAPDGEVEDYQFEILPFAGSEYDFGDAPDGPYATLLASNGARHTIVPNFHLGASVDSEANGQPSAAATGDDLADLADEDGVEAVGPIVLGKGGTVEVTASAAGYLDAWIDLNGTAGWQADEKLFDAEPLSPGVNTLSFTVPATAPLGDTYVRFRFSSTGGLDATGEAADGEVEDYMVTVEQTADTIGLYDTLGRFHIKNSLGSGYPDQSFYWGPGTNAGWQAVAGDWDGDGVDTIGLYDPNGKFHIKNSLGSGMPDVSFYFGLGPDDGWRAIAGDWDGDGLDTIGLYDPQGRFHVKNTLRGGNPDQSFYWGPGTTAGWQPIAGDWDGDGFDTIGLYDTLGRIHIKNTLGGGNPDQSFYWGPGTTQGWEALAADWDGDGDDTIGLYDTQGRFHVKNTLGGGMPDQSFYWGPGTTQNWQPLAGDWNGPEGESLTLSVSSAAPGESLVAGTRSALDPSAVTHVVFTDGDGNELPVLASVLTPTSVEVLVPPLFDTGTFAFTAGTVSVSVVQETADGPVGFGDADGFQIGALSDTGVAAGAVTAEFLDEMLALLDAMAADYQAIADASGGTVNVTSLLNDIQTLRAQYVTAQNLVLPLVNQQTAQVDLGQAPGLNNLNLFLDAQSLALLDQVTANLLLNEPIASGQASTPSSRLYAPAGAESAAVASDPAQSIGDQFSVLLDGTATEITDFATKYRAAGSVLIGVGTVGAAFAFGAPALVAGGVLGAMWLGISTLIPAAQSAAVEGGASVMLRGSAELSDFETTGGFLWSSAWDSVLTESIALCGVLAGPAGEAFATMTNTVRDIKTFYDPASPQSHYQQIVDNFGAIVDNLEPPPSLTLSIDNEMVNEGDTGTTGTGLFVTLSEANTQDVSFWYSTADSTATAGVDYVGVGPTQKTIPAGSTATAIPLSVIGNYVDEPDRTFFVNLSNPVNATIADGQGWVTIMDDDTAGINVSPSGGLVTSEDGGTDSFSVILTSRPTANVTIGLSSSDTGEGTVGPSSLTFTPGDWNSPKQVTVYGEDDAQVDGDVHYSIITAPATSSDSKYGGLNAADVSATNLDNDGVDRFDGSYTGSYSGTVQVPGYPAYPVSGPVAFTVSGGSITVTVPGAGSGTVSESGSADFGAAGGAVGDASFTGTFVVSGGGASASGGWTNPYGSGSWNASRNALHAAGGEAVDPLSPLAPLTEDALALLAAEAAAEWNSLGVETDFSAVDFVVVDLPGSLLGLADQETVFIDRDAAGHGWFVDSTPGLDEEFATTEPRGPLRAVDPEAVDRMDLLTVLSHELGHVLGLADLDSSIDGLMSGVLESGVRRNPGPAEVDLLLAQL